MLINSAMAKTDKQRSTYFLLEDEQYMLIHREASTNE
jgi:hypothetical protein